MDKNATPGNKYLSCQFIQSGLAFSFNHIGVCCNNPGTGLSSPALAQYSDSYSYVSTIATGRKKLKESHKIGKIHPHCIGCVHLSEGLWPDDADKIVELSILCFQACNLKCIYCDIFSGSPKRHFNVANTLSELAGKKLISSWTTVRITGGEPSIWPEFEEVMRILISADCRVVIYSNCVSFSQSLHDAISQGRCTLFVSIDASSSSLYEYIHGKDAFKNVLSNISTYNSAAQKSPYADQSLVIPKFILMSENVHEVMEFIDLMKHMGFNNVCISLDFAHTVAPELRRETRLFEEVELVDIYARLYKKCWENDIAMLAFGTELVWMTDENTSLLQHKLKLVLSETLYRTPVFAFNSYADICYLLKETVQIFDGRLYLSNGIELADYSELCRDLLLGNLHDTDMIPTAYNQLALEYENLISRLLPPSQDVIDVTTPDLWGEGWGLVKNDCFGAYYRYLGPLHRSSIYLKLKTNKSYTISLFLHNARPDKALENLVIEATCDYDDLGCHSEHNNIIHVTKIRPGTESNDFSGTYTTVRLTYSSPPPFETPFPATCSFSANEWELSFSKLIIKEIQHHANEPVVRNVKKMFKNIKSFFK